MEDKFAAVEKDSLDLAFSLYEKFLEICPEDVWQEHFGGRPVAQQIYHAISASAIYLQSLTGEQIANDFPEAIDPFPEAGLPPREDRFLPAKAEALRFLRTIKSSVDQLFCRLKEAELLQLNEPISKFLGGKINNAGALAIMAAHMLYHLGSGDAALRARGIPGAFSGLALVKKYMAGAG